MLNKKMSCRPTSPVRKWKYHYALTFVGLFDHDVRLPSIRAFKILTKQITVFHCIKNMQTVLFCIYIVMNISVFEKDMDNCYNCCCGYSGFLPQIFLALLN